MKQNPSDEVVVVGLDAGNAIIKWARENFTGGEFPHAFIKLSKQAKRNVDMRNTGSNDPSIATINGNTYQFGIMAQRDDGFVRKAGELRYTPEYYGVLAAYCIAQALSADCDNVWLAGSFPPGDINYCDNLIDSVLGKWVVQIGKVTRTFTVTDAFAIDEPICGFNNAGLTQKGVEYSDKTMIKGYTLIMDIGGHTTDIITVAPGGIVDFKNANSIDDLGIISIINDVRRDFRAENAKLLAGSSLDDDIVEAAIRTGIMDMRGLGKKDCKAIVRDATADMMARVVDFYNQYGGATRYNTILLTGGGSALMENIIRARIKHKNIKLAHNDPKKLHRANVEGIIKTIHMARAKGTL